LALSFRSFSPWSLEPLAFEAVVRQWEHMADEAYSPRGGWKVNKRERKGLGSQCLLQRHAPNTLTFFHKAPRPKGSPTSPQHHRLVSKPSTHRPLEQQPQQPSWFGETTPCSVAQACGSPALTLKVSVPLYHCNSIPVSVITLYSPAHYM
jgi:hypothetical protein